MATYVSTCASCLHEQVFAKQARANAAQRSHARANPTHAVRVTRVRGGRRMTRPGTHPALSTASARAC
jgi:hypothetical protein